MNKNHTKKIRSNKKPNHFNKKKRNLPPTKTFIKKSYKNENNPISLEYVLQLLVSNKINISPLQQEDIQSIRNGFFSKLNLLIKNNIVIVNNKNDLLLNDNTLNNNINEYSYITIKSHIMKDHYIVNISNLNNKNTHEEEVIINNLREDFDLKNKNILAKITLLEEKIIVYPILYLHKISNDQIKKTTTSYLTRGIYKNIENKNVLISLSTKNREHINILNIPKNIPNNSMIETIVFENNYNTNALFINSLSQSNESLSSVMMSISQYNLRNTFSEEIKELVKTYKEPLLENRKDLTKLPFVTIDDSDAKDFDDAIYAEEIPLKENTYKVYVAIADVTHYIKQNDLIDIEAQKRGNSVYFPGFVIPMLPEELSNNWCSLKPNEKRACLVMECIINRNGILESFEFYRALIKSHARLTYKQVDNVLNGTFDETMEPLRNIENIINPLYKVYLLLNKRRELKKPLNISTLETQFILDNNNEISSIKIRENLTSHKIVEEFMILANIAAAKLISYNGLSQSGKVIYRVHKQPTQEKLLALSDVLQSLNINIKPPRNINADFFNNILERFKNHTLYNVINDYILRTQSQAEYVNEKLGHFGLSLDEYCHFTSPIRRYADLMIHRLILTIIDNKDYDYSIKEISNIAQSISNNEKIAFNAEKSAQNRLLAKWLTDKIGQSFMSQISSITNAGMFVNIIENGVSGLIPMRTISKNFVTVNIKQGTIKDSKRKKLFKLGDKIPVIIKEADEIKGLLTFLIDENKMRKR